MMRIEPIYDLAEVPDTFGLDIVARLMNKTQDWVKKMACDGILPAERIDGRFVFRKEVLISRILSM